MIKIITKGVYKLIITKDRKKILYLGNQSYQWIHIKSIGDLLLFSNHPHEAQYVLAQGEYLLYKVKKEPNYIDLQHLELSIGMGDLQGYLLLTGLPTIDKIRSRIIATHELIGNKNSTIQSVDTN